MLAAPLARVPIVNRPRCARRSQGTPHFRYLVDKKIITIDRVASSDNVADIFTKALPYDVFALHRTSLGVVA